jgi:hypothetical protein
VIARELNKEFALKMEQHLEKAKDSAVYLGKVITKVEGCFKVILQETTPWTY